MELQVRLSADPDMDTRHERMKEDLQNIIPPEFRARITRTHVVVGVVIGVLGVVCVCLVILVGVAYSSRGYSIGGTTAAIKGDYWNKHGHLQMTAYKKFFIFYICIIITSYIDIKNKIIGFILSILI